MDDFESGRMADYPADERDGPRVKHEPGVGGEGEDERSAKEDIHRHR